MGTADACKAEWRKRGSSQFEFAADAVAFGSEAGESMEWVLRDKGWGRKVGVPLHLRLPLPSSSDCGIPPSVLREKFVDACMVELYESMEWVLREKGWGRKL